MQGVGRHQLHMAARAVLDNPSLSHDYDVVYKTRQPEQAVLRDHDGVPRFLQGSKYVSDLENRGTI